MRESTPSFTAAWVAAMRGLGGFLPERLRLVDDPFGLRFAGHLQAMRRHPSLERGLQLASPAWMRGRLRRFVVYMQLRTRVIDDDVREFVRTGGRQVVLLGAGFDCRAWRLDALRDATVFEVDHPATQEKKRARMPDPPIARDVVFVPWNFETDPLDRLPARLALDGHDAKVPTLTILEGVLMYLTEEAATATLAAIRKYSPPGSPLCFNYMDRSRLESRVARANRMGMRLIGEPFRLGFDPALLPAWLDERGFVLERNETPAEVASRLIGPEAGRRFQTERGVRRHFSLARVA